jgi:hypothetical protein
VALGVLPGVEIEAHAVEVKLARGLDTSAVFETLAFRRWVHFQWLLVLVAKEAQPWSMVERPPSDYAPLAKRGAPLRAEQEAHRRAHRIYRAAVQQGVGLIVAPDHCDGSTWDLAVRAQHQTPPRYRLDRFLSTQLDPESKAALSERMSGVMRAS